MKNKNLLTLLFSIVALSGCSLVPELKPTVAPTEAPIEDIKPGEIPSGGEGVTMDEAVNAFKDLYKTWNQQVDAAYERYKEIIKEKEDKE